MVSEDILKVFHKFYILGKFEKVYMCYILLLFPRNWVEEAKDFHPISHINEVYNIISKVLVNRCLLL